MWRLRKYLEQDTALNEESDQMNKAEHFAERLSKSVPHQLHIPPEARKRHIAILGMNGSGKTSVAKAEIIEPALIAGERVCNVDPTGVGWGLRLVRSGKAPAFPIYIVGGEHQDFALEYRSGETWADIVGTSSDSFVFDTSQMTVGKRSEWFKDFAEALIVKNKGPLHFVLDEAHLFAPQAGAQGGGIAPQMLHATNNLLSLGRSKGLRVTMISQRAAKLHKDSLTQAHTLVAMMMTGPQDRAAVKDWIADQADAAKGAEIIASLPSMKPGEGWIWAPREGVLERVKFSRPMTFDSSSAPDTAEGAAIKLTPIDPATIEGRLAQVAQEKKANDPALLRSEIARLEAKVRTLEVIPAVASSVDVDEVYRDGYRTGHEHGYNKGAFDQCKADDKIVKQHLAFMASVRDRFEQIYVMGGELLKASAAPASMLPIVKWPDDAVPHSAVRPAPIATPAQGAPKVLRSTVSAPANGGSGSKPSEHRIIDSLMFWKNVGIDEPSREQVAMVAGYKPSGGRFRNLLGGLRTGGVVDYPAEGRVRILPDAPVTAVTMSLDMARAFVRSVLSPSQLNLATAVPQHRTISRQDLAEATEYDAQGGRFRNLLGSLRTLNILIYPSDGMVSRSAWASELLQ